MDVCFKCGYKFPYRVGNHKQYFAYHVRDMEVHLHVHCVASFYIDGDYKDYDALKMFIKQHGEVK